MVDSKEPESHGERRTGGVNLCIRAIQPPSEIRCPLLSRHIRTCAIQIGRQAIVVCTGSDDCGASQPGEALIEYDRALMLGCPLLELFELARHG